MLSIAILLTKADGRVFFLVKRNISVQFKDNYKKQE